MSDVFLYGSLCCLRHGLLLNPELSHLAGLDGQRTGAICPRGTGMQKHAGFYVGTGDLNSGPHARVTST